MFLKQTVRQVIRKPRSLRVKFNNCEFGKSWDVGGSEAKRWTDVPEIAVQDWRCRKEFARNETVGAGRRDGSFVTVRSVCFSSIMAWTRSANQPSPPPLTSSRPPITVYPPASANTCPRSIPWRRGCNPGYAALWTHTQLCLPARTCSLASSNACSSNRSNLQPGVESSEDTFKWTDPLLTSADKVAFPHGLFFFPTLGRMLGPKVQKMLFLLFPLRWIGVKMLIVHSCVLHTHNSTNFYC